MTEHIKFWLLCGFSCFVYFKKRRKAVVVQSLAVEQFRKTIKRSLFVCYDFHCGCLHKVLKFSKWNRNGGLEDTRDAVREACHIGCQY